MDTHPVSSIGAKRSEGNQTDDETSQQEVAEEEKMERQNDDCGDDGEEEIAREKMDRHNEGGNDGENESAGENTKKERHPHAAWVERHHQQLDIKPDEDIWEKIEAAGPLVSILEASRWLEPSLSLRCRVTVQGHLPDKVLAHAVIVRRLDPLGREHGEAGHLAESSEPACAQACLSLLHGVSHDACR